MKVNKEAFGQLENKLHLKHYQMAELIGIDRTQYWRLLNGKSRPSSETLEKFKKAFPKLKLEQYFFYKDVA